MGLAAERSWPEGGQMDGSVEMWKGRNTRLAPAGWRRVLRAWPAALVGLVVPAALTSGALAAVPTSTQLEGVLTSAGGAPAADGDYDVTFAIYDAETGGTASWTETAKLKVVGGRFNAALGATTALDPGKLAALNTAWVSVKVGAAPELPRQRVRSAPYALVAAKAVAVECTGCVGADQIANGSIAAAKVAFNYAGSTTKGGPAVELDCTACVSVAEMKFDGDVDLAGNSIKAKNGTFSGDLAAATVTATSFAGDGSKLTGIKTPAGECKNAGEVVKGINPDGSLKCVLAMDPTALPKDGLNEISNDLLSNQFVDTIFGQADIKIPDNTGSDAVSNLDFPDIGTAQTFELYVEVANTDLSKVALKVLPPDDKKTGWTLCDPCGKADEKSYKVTFSKDNMPKVGNLTTWIGANAKGIWNLKASDTGYCVPQAPGNATLCDTANKTDGTIVKWSIKIQTLSNKKAKVAGDLYVDGKIWGKDNGHGVPGGDLDIGAGAKVAGTLVVSGEIVGKNAAYGGVFVYWAHKTCPAGATKLYEGRGFSGHYSHAGANRGECIVGGDPGATYSYEGDLLYTMHTAGSMPPGIPSDRALSCAICSWDKGTCMETWGTDKCPTGWQKMYGGYSVGPHYTHSGPAGGRYCLDPNGFDTSTAGTGNGYLYGTRVQGSAYGSSWPTGVALKCGLCCRQ